MAPLHESRPSSAPSEKKVSPIVFMKRRIRGELPATSRGARRVAGDLPPTLQRSPSRCELDKLEAVLRDTTEHIMRDEGQRKLFEVFLHTEYCVELAHFWAECQDFHASAVRRLESMGGGAVQKERDDELSQFADSIFTRYLSTGSTKFVHVSARVATDVSRELKNGPFIRVHIFKEAQSEVVNFLALHKLRLFTKWLENQPVEPENDDISFATDVSDPFGHRSRRSSGWSDLDSLSDEDPLIGSHSSAPARPALDSSRGSLSSRSRRASSALESSDSCFAPTTDKLRRHTSASLVMGGDKGYHGGHPETKAPSFDWRQSFSASERPRSSRPSSSASSSEYVPEDEGPLEPGDNSLLPRSPPTPSPYFTLEEGARGRDRRYRRRSSETSRNEEPMRRRRSSSRSSTNSMEDHLNLARNTAIAAAAAAFRDEADPSITGQEVGRRKVPVINVSPNSN